MNWARFPFDLANYFYAAVVAEWLRRLTRNQIPSGSAGSNPADCENLFHKFYPINLSIVKLSNLYTLVPASLVQW